MSDVLADKAVDQVKGWYSRLAMAVASIQIEGQTPLAAIFLQHWLDNKDPASTFSFNAPNYLKDSPYVRSVLLHHRRVFLSQEKAHGSAGGKLGGVVPRLQGRKGFAQWNVNKDPYLPMHYESLVELPLSRQVFGTKAEKDILHSLHGFQLASDVRVQVRTSKPVNAMALMFVSWQARVRDRYDWDYSEHLTVDNPDYGSKAKDAIEPDNKKLTVYHSNARRLEEAKLAAPYDIESSPWFVNDSAITGEGQVDATNH